MAKMRLVSLLAFSMIAVSSLAGCSKGSEGGAAKSDPTTDPKATANSSASLEYKGGPVELLVLDVNSGTTDEQFQKYFIDPIKAKYPQITLKETREGLDKLIAGGTPPDMVLVSNQSLATLIQADLPEDLNPMIKQYNINLSRFEPTVVTQMQKLGGQKAFYGIPFAMNYGAMVYNKDIFDKFGVSYPKETMTWEEALELGKKLTRKDSGTNYIGILPPDLRSMYWHYSLPIYDVTKEKASFTSDQHVKVFQLLNQFYSIPGYVENGVYQHNVDLFFKEQRMALYPNWAAAMIFFFDRAGTKDAFKWDVTAFPSYSDRPGIGASVDFHMAVVNKASKNKDAAYQVLMSLQSDTVQTQLNKGGRLSVLKNDDIRKTFAADSGIYNGKNLQSIFKVKPAELPAQGLFDPKINALLNGEVTKNVVVNGMDINTALRNGEEKANKEIVIKQ